MYNVFSQTNTAICIVLSVVVVQGVIDTIWARVRSLENQRKNSNGKQLNPWPSGPPHEENLTFIYFQAEFS
jgi:hypothetical protein